MKSNYMLVYHLDFAVAACAAFGLFAAASVAVGLAFRSLLLHWDYEDAWVVIKSDI